MTDKRQVIFVDVDGVLTEHNQTFLEQINRRFGATYAYEDITSFHYDECMEAEHAEVMLNMWHGENLYDNWPPEPGAMEAVREMRTFARVIALSSPMLGHIKSKYQWLLEQGFGRDGIIFAHDKSLMRGALLIDDRMKNIYNFTGEAICFARPWNTGWNTSKGIRTSNWDEIVARAREIILSEDPENSMRSAIVELYNNGES